MIASSSGIDPLTGQVKASSGQQAEDGTLEPPPVHRTPSEESSVELRQDGGDKLTPIYLSSDATNLSQDEWLTSHHSMDMSMDSLDRGNRENWGYARRHKQTPELQRHASDATVPVDNTTTWKPLAQIQVADSQFLGYAKCGITQESQVLEFISQLRMEHPTAAHIPYAYLIPSSENDPTDGFEEDGEPENSTGPFLLEQVRDSRHEKEGVWLFPEEAGGIGSDPHSGTCVVIVRYFGNQLLGVTCGRLSQCYQRIAQVTLHRLFRGCHIPLQLDFTNDNNNSGRVELPGVPKGNLYGLAGGDTELHLNIVPGDKETLMNTLLQQLNFEGFKGAQGEILPRLQNLQADFYEYDTTTCAPIVSEKGNIIPIYRYPGNYQGDEWETFPWSSFSLDVKEKVENGLPHFYNAQKMNHCVTNFYRHAEDYIAHHSDKDLDLDRTAAIVSVSIGAERILELRRRAEPRDLTRLVLPHGSMLLLGPVTNQYFTHSILPIEREESKTCHSLDANGQVDQNARISLTLRHVTTYMDTQTRRLFGQGVEIRTLQELRRAQRWDNICFILGFGAFQRVVRALDYSVPPVLEAALPRPPSGTSSVSEKNSRLRSLAVVLGSAAVAWLSYARLRKIYLQRKEERSARQFFTSKSTSGTKY